MQTQINTLQEKVAMHEERFGSHDRELQRLSLTIEAVHPRLDKMNKDMLKKTDFEELRENLTNKDAVNFAKKVLWALASLLTAGGIGVAFNHWGG